MIQRRLDQRGLTNQISGKQRHLSQRHLETEGRNKFFVPVGCSFKTRALKQRITLFPAEKLVSLLSVLFVLWLQTVST